MLDLSLGDLAGLEAAGANPGLTDIAVVVTNGDLLNIGTKRPVAYSV